MKRYKILGPFDRYNYGDLLFPLILEKELDKNGNQVQYYGLVDSDLSMYGAKKTESIEAFYADLAPDDKIIIAGGESLCATWAGLYSYLNDGFNKVYSVKYLRSLDIRLGLLSNYARIVNKGKTQYPFVPNRSELPIDQVDTYFNAVGGSALLSWSDARLEKFCRKLTDSKVIGVRDEVTFSRLQPYLKKSQNLFLTPDSAILMQQYLNQDKNASVGKNATKDSVGDRYAFFQVGAEKTDSLAQIISNLEEILKKSTLDIVLCPIGYALGHDDLKPLRDIYKTLNANYPGRVKIIDKLVNLYEIMSLIENAEIYIGTSLHGAITSMSFGTPYVTFNKKIFKLANYLATWGVCDLKTQYTANDIFKGFEKASEVSRKEILAESEKQKVLTKEFLSKIRI
jgi:hypothetical protein